MFVYCFSFVQYPTGKVPMEGDGPLMACQQISMENMPTLHVVQVTPYIQEVRYFLSTH